ncbi:MAG: acylneuraminate cytidylyltransferase family protein [Moorea sp. SIO3C2]|nr:acylneuraminate cytidylyltransferase family protein [Moorena sp. SIO3C2]
MIHTERPIIAFLPCRRGSERVKRKNTRPFAGIEGGLTKIKIEQLLNCPEIDSIVVSTDDLKVAEICNTVAKDYSKSVIICERPAHLATSETSTDDLIKYVPEIITEGVVLWTHVTSPFVDSSIYSNSIKTYCEQIALDTCDSLMSVTKVQKFLWDCNGPINHEPIHEKWPRTQTLPVIYEVNSAIFLAPIELYIQGQDRIGKRVNLFELTTSQSIDIDWEEDFRLAEKIW